MVPYLFYFLLNMGNETIWSIGAYAKFAGQVCVA